ncbi:MAG: [FeFe] hydrogenase H-cluster radical SAM maturase HydE [Deltaproteobacteria bacterium]|nr:[FeFe] hydrogenase H-cluster radical SAM maturase HydE [Deltaproteobacteria bacterium]
MREPGLPIDFSDRSSIEAWLCEGDPIRLEELWIAADEMRREHVGDAVHLRGLVEISNHCVRQCLYCGIRAGHRELVRYRLTMSEVLECAHEAVRRGYGTLVVQAGEDPGWTRDSVCDLIRRVKSETGLAVTLSLGERDDDEILAWKNAGADRYLLRFETSDRALFARIHPGRVHVAGDRVQRLRELRRMGFEIGGGVMVGIPGQSYASLADDVMTFRELDLDMIGVGPFLAHPATPMGRGEIASLPVGEQVPATKEMTCKVVALARLACPDANIPSTTALATLAPEQGRELGLARGANIVMPNLTPFRYRSLYEIYPAKSCISEDPVDFNAQLVARIRAIGREVGEGPGAAPAWRRR